MPVDGSAVRTIDLPVEPLEYAVWRPPDGAEIVFQARDGERRAIYAVHPDGTGFRQVSEKSAAGSFSGPVELTNDGSELFFIRVFDGDVHIRVLDLDTGEQRAFDTNLPKPADWDGGVDNTVSPTISPDGQSLLFVRFWNSADTTINEQLRLASVDGDGSDARPIGPVRRIAQQINPIYQAFAPDGSAILIHAFDTTETWVADPDDGSVELVDWGVVEDPPSWQRRAP